MTRLARAPVFLMAVALASGLLAGAAPASAHDRQHGEQHPAPPPGGGNEAVRLRIPDVPVVDQDGRKLRFWSDLVRGRVVAINFIYTTCGTACPLLGIAFAGGQGQMGERVGRDVFLVSVTTDPVTDTPARLKAWGAKYGAGPGWTLVTGSRPEIARLVTALGASIVDRDDHPTFVLLGDDVRGRWRRAYGLMPAARLVPMIAEMLSEGGEVPRPAADRR